jgi:hypothetical protein
MMVIEYLNLHRLSDPIQFQTVAEVASQVETDFDGTDIDKVRLLNRDRRVLAAVPSVEFDARKIQRDFMDILHDVNAKNPRERLPVIAWLIVGEGYDESCHAVVVTQIDREAHEITYLDPYFGQRSENLDDFSRKWEKADKWLVRLKLGQRESKTIEEFSPP